MVLYLLQINFSIRVQQHANGQTLTRAKNFPAANRHCTIFPPNQKWFDEEEAWVMLGDLVNCLREYSLKGLSHGDIQPHNVFVIEDCEMSKKIKILDSCMLNEAESGYDRMRNDSEYAAALSPQAMFC
jgi:hypothetical protein